MNDFERSQQLQAIYSEIEKEPPTEKVKAYFKSKPYQLKERRGSGRNDERGSKERRCQGKKSAV